MLALKRDFDLSGANVAEVMQAYEAVLNDLHDAVRERMGLRTDPLENWPDGEWTTATRSATSTEWRQGVDNSVGLLELTWREEQSNCVWHLDLSIGWIKAVVAIAEVWRVEAPGRAIPYDALSA